MWDYETVLSLFQIQVKLNNIPIKTKDFRIRLGFQEQGYSLADDFEQFTHSVYHLLYRSVKPQDC